MTIGQLCFYDQVKQSLMATPYFQDNLATHFTASLAAGAIATTMTQPMDVLKTRSMNAKPGEFKSSVDLIKYTAKNGPMAFYKVGILLTSSLHIFLMIFSAGLCSCFCAARASDYPHLRIV